ncbi:MAG: response regulator transcription factor [Bacteroidota bacterium]
MKRKFPNVLEIADLRIDVNNYICTKADEIIPLTKKELTILHLLASNPRQVQSRQSILETAWDEDVLVGSRTIDVHIRRLRKKIGADYIRTVKGIGYQFVN